MIAADALPDRSSVGDIDTVITLLADDAGVLCVMRLVVNAGSTTRIGEDPCWIPRIVALELVMLTASISTRGPEARI